LALGPLDQAEEHADAAIAAYKEAGDREAKFCVERPSG
jgi:hypothetical protein